MSSRSDRTEVLSQEQERAERAASVAAMLERWAKQDVSLEPGWNIDDVEGATIVTTNPRHFERVVDASEWANVSLDVGPDD